MRTTHLPTVQETVYTDSQACPPAKNQPLLVVHATPVFLPIYAPLVFLAIHAPSNKYLPSHAYPF